MKTERTAAASQANQFVDRFGAKIAPTCPAFFLDNSREYLGPREYSIEEHGERSLLTCTSICRVPQKIRSNLPPRGPSTEQVHRRENDQRTANDDQPWSHGGDPDSVHAMNLPVMSSANRRWWRRWRGLSEGSGELWHFAGWFPAVHAGRPYER